MFIDTTNPSGFRPHGEAAAPTAWDRHVRRARALCAGQSRVDPMFTRTDEQLAQALLRIEVRSNPAAKLAQLDAFYASNGVRRGDDKRGDALSVPQITPSVREPNDRVISLLTQDAPLSAADWAEIDGIAA